MEIVTSQDGTAWGPYVFTALFVAAFALYVAVTVALAFTEPRKARKR